MILKPIPDDDRQISKQEVLFRMAGDIEPSRGEVRVYGSDGTSRTVVRLFDVTPGAWGIVAEWWVE